MVIAEAGRATAAAQGECVRPATQGRQRDQSEDPAEAAAAGPRHPQGMGCKLKLSKCSLLGCTLIQVPHASRLQSPLVCLGSLDREQAEMCGTVYVGMVVWSGLEHRHMSSLVC